MQDMNFCQRAASLRDGTKGHTVLDVLLEMTRNHSPKIRDLFRIKKSNIVIFADSSVFSTTTVKELVSVLGISKLQCLLHVFYVHIF